MTRLNVSRGVICNIVNKPESLKDILVDTFDAIERDMGLGSKTNYAGIYQEGTFDEIITSATGFEKVIPNRIRKSNP